MGDVGTIAIFLFLGIRASLLVMSMLTVHLSIRIKKVVFVQIFSAKMCLAVNNHFSVFVACKYVRIESFYRMT